MGKISAFSLVELMVAVGIVGVLVTLAVPRYHQFMVQARRGEAKSNLSHIATLQETYKVDHFSYYSGAAMSGTNGVGYRDGSGYDGSCDDPATDVDEGINNHLGFRPNGCGQLRYFYQLRNSGNTAVASAASDAKGRHIYPDCSGGGTPPECGYVSGDAVRLAMSSGKPEVCRNITNYCPGSSTTLTPPPTPTPTPTICYSTSQCCDGSNTEILNTFGLVCADWKGTFNPSAADKGCCHTTCPSCPPATTLNPLANTVCAGDTFTQTSTTTTCNSSPPCTTVVSATSPATGTKGTHNSATCTGTFDANACTCTTTPPPCPIGETMMGGQCCTDDSPTRSNYNSCVVMDGKTWTSACACACNPGDNACASLPNRIFRDYPHCSCKCAPDASGNTPSIGVCLADSKEFDSNSCTCIEPEETCDSGDYSSGLVSAAELACDGAQGSFHKVPKPLGNDPANLGLYTCLCYKHCTKLNGTDLSPQRLMSDVQEACRTNQGVFTNSFISAGKFDCKCKNYCATLNGMPSSRPLSEVEEACTTNNGSFTSTRITISGYFHCSCEPTCTSTINISYDAATNTTSTTSTTHTTPVSVTDEEGSCSSNVGMTAFDHTTFGSNTGTIQTDCSGQTPPYRFRRDPNGSCTCTDPLVRNGMCVGPMLRGLIRTNPVPGNDFRSNNDELAACYKSCDHKTTLADKKQCYADKIAATVGTSNNIYRACDAMELFNSHSYHTEGVVATRDCGNVESVLNAFKNTGMNPGTSPCNSLSDFIFIQAP